MRRHLEGAAVVLWALCLAVYLRDGGGLPNLVKPAATAVTYVYEKDETAVPAAVAGALDALNRQGIKANAIDDDVVNGKGEVPAQYKASILASKESGIPCLVVTAHDGNEVLKVVKSPTTETEVLGAVK